MMAKTLFAVLVLGGVTLLALPVHPSGDAIRATALRQSQQGNIIYTITGATGAKPRLAIPEFSVVGTSAEVQQAAKTISTVLWDDIEFEEEFAMVSRESAAKIPATTKAADLPYDRWRELGADAVVLGTVTQTAAGIMVEVQVIGTRGEVSRLVVFGERYSGCNLKDPRRCAHVIADDFHKKQRNLDGVAQTMLAFSSDRQNQPAGRVVPNTSQEIYISDYDGGNPRRFTVNESLNVSPSWAPDGRSIAYESYASHYPEIFMQNVDEARPLRPVTGTATFPAFSPDGSKVAFAAIRDSPSFNIYVMNRDGSDLRQLTNSNLDIAPAWSPDGTHIVFASGRSGGHPQLYLMSADGTGVERLNCDSPYCNRPVWSPAQMNKIACTCGTDSGFDSGFDICLIDMATRRVIKLTDGVGSNDQPSFAPNGRHIVFATTRWGKVQLAMVDLKGTLSKRRITEIGNNNFPSWSRASQ